MKKNLFLAVVTAVLLASCSSNEAIDETTLTSSNAVGFGTFIGRNTKAASTDIANVKVSGFYVTAFSTGATSWTTPSVAPDFMYNQKVEWNTDKWEYTPVKYWPGVISGSTYGKVTFFGWNDVAGTVASASSYAGIPTLGFTCAQLAVNQKDLVADMLTDKTLSDGAVKFEFDHILSRIGFAAKLADQYSGAEVKVTSIKVYYAEDKVKSEGTYTFNTDNTAGSIWSFTPSAFMAEDTPDEMVAVGGVTLPNDATHDAIGLNASSNHLMLIPQSVVAGDVYIDMEYTVTTGSQTVTYKITKDLPAITWAPGKHYTYTFTLTLNPVEFDTDISVNDWTSDSSTGINL
ncbi:MAG: fimbrillin family protein [Prevotella sp.]|jgi:hypothetical protein|nr:fimbrillin family protein [Prevotella sp.]